MGSFLLDKYSGELMVDIEGAGEFTLNFSDPESTLFDYVGQACANLCTNLTTRLTVKTRPEDWEIIYFSPENRVIRVKQIGGEEMFCPESDDDEKLTHFLDLFRGKE